MSWVMAGMRACGDSTRHQHLLFRVGYYPFFLPSLCFFFGLLGSFNWCRRRWRAGQVSFPAKDGEAARTKRAKTSSILPPKVLPRHSRAAGTSSQRHVSNLTYILLINGIKYASFWFDFRFFYITIILLFNIKRLLFVRLLFRTVTKLNYLLSATYLPNNMVYIQAIF